MTPGHTSLQEKHSERRFPLRTQAGPECIFLLCIGSTSSVLSISSDGAVTREKGPTGGNGWKKWRWHVASRLHHGWRHRPRGREGPPASFYRLLQGSNEELLPAFACILLHSSQNKERKKEKPVHALEKVPFSLGTLANSVSICGQQGSG